MVARRWFAVALSGALGCGFVGGVAACGSSSEPAKPPRGEHGEQGHGEHGHPGERHGEHHHGHEGGIKAFHDVLAPAYHMEPGSPRLDKACAGVASMRTAQLALAGESKGDAAKWKAAVEALGASVSALDVACQAQGKPEVDAKLEAVHSAFHAVMEAGR